MPSDPQQSTPPLLYANWVRIAATPYDVALDFGYREDDGPPRVPDARVVMAWEHAKDVLTLLQNTVEQYEKQVGPIREFETTITPAVQPKPKPPAQRRKRK
jgi:Protein of unknown function (DUF3467)